MGKVPTRGDFINHNIAPELREVWFEWCQAGLAVSREQLGDNWADAYLTAPVWHFALHSDVLCDDALLGTMIPSVDRVGRYFPFLVMTPFTASPYTGWQQPEWSSQLEELIIGVLDDQWQEAEWFTRLQQVTLPEPNSGLVTWTSHEGNVRLPAPLSEQALLHGLLERTPNHMLWWTQGSAYVEPSLLMTAGLPQVGQFSALIAGNWTQNNWHEGRLIE